MRITIEISEEDAVLIRELLVNSRSDLCSHGVLTMKRLAEMLMEDCALAVRRPGSWEGSNMIHVLSSHGYLV